jgi:hypothetical protein
MASTKRDYIRMRARYFPNLPKEFDRISEVSAKLQEIRGEEEMEGWEEEP